MKQYEYKIHYLRFSGPLNKREDYLIEELNLLGKDGWRLNRMFPDLKLRTFGAWAGAINLLVEREILES